MKDFYISALQNHKSQGLYRSLVDSDIADAVTIKRGNKKIISFASNDYFGLSQNSQVKKAAILAIDKYGTGSGASRYITGNNSLYKKLEKEIAKIKSCEDSIVFSSGYSCAIGVLPALANEGDLIIADKLIHSSLIDAAKLSSAKFMRFSHNDISHAKNILEENRNKFNKCFIVTESIFSMDGDLGKIQELAKLSCKYNAMLIIDDAHGLFVKDFNDIITTAQTIILGTLSKAVGCVGGYVAGEKNIIDYLRNFAKSQIYSTALPPSVLASSLKSLQIINKSNLAEKTLKNAEYFCELMDLPKPQSAIVVLVLFDAVKTVEISKNLQDRGFLVGAIRYPTVEKNKARLRITFSAQHKKSNIEKFVKILKNLL